MTEDSKGLVSFFMLALIVAAYFLPLIVANARDHHNTVSIALFNLFLGWTGIGWIAALIWSFSAVAKQPDAVPAEVARPEPASTSYERLEKLADLKERGHLTSEEFEAEKAKVLGK